MNTIITIGRQFGSGGHEIGEKLAEHYGIQCSQGLRRRVVSVRKCSGITMSGRPIPFFTI